METKQERGKKNTGVCLWNVEREGKIVDKLKEEKSHKWRRRNERGRAIGKENSDKMKRKLLIGLVQKKIENGKIEDEIKEKNIIRRIKGEIKEKKRMRKRKEKYYEVLFRKD